MFGDCKEEWEKFGRERERRFKRVLVRCGT